ncbi:hypothetical protein CI15_15025 [Paraburkholderia monticola]|uniref:Bacterial CdiA-CT RNAse A domain-containing protein n=1 Tax=Paraburkholderia monticola TaxID=1399968 RepID=A0A149PR46_9BURK|nr:RNase A-like domain-containing protein [Paraburkholderia monticola]KXU87459.1 hypothetical protein CI15_15025 [Paraburkholderia monticola]
MSYQQDSGSVRVVLSAPQLAAVLTRQSISPTEMLSNRLWGGLQLVGGLLEMVGAGALCVMPEPTMASKAGCIVFGAHASDTAAAGLRQVWTGQDTATLTQQGTTKLAKAMNADPHIAERAISEVMQKNSTKISCWSKSARGGGKLVLVDDVAGEIGYGVVRETNHKISLNKIRMILKCESYNGMPYYVLTAYLIK